MRNGRISSMNQKRIFYISVIGKPDSLNRAYSDQILDLIKRKSFFNEQYIIERADSTSKEDLYENLSEAISSNQYEGYIILLDCLDDSNGICNPNVMFEFGAIKHLDKPFVLIGSHEPEKYPFDIKGLNVETVPIILTNYIKSNYNKDINIVKRFYTESKSTGKEYDEISTFLENIFGKYNASLQKHQQADENKHIPNNVLMNELKEIKEYVMKIGNTAEYIDGEPAAFNAVKEAVKNAKFSLRTSRFANQSIVLSNATKEQKEFMHVLYDSSKRLKQNSHRIICNNSPLKWMDIYYALYYGGNESKVYIRKNEYSIHFELVVIDESVAFIHFYQPDHAEGKGHEPHDNEIEKINSTLKIQGNSICQKLSNIFNRLHHKDFNKSSPHDPSRTLLGIPANDTIDDEYVNNGCLYVDGCTPEHSTYISPHDEQHRRNTIINMMKSAFDSWPISDHQDKQNMLIGISLIEKNCDFIHEKQSKNQIDESEADIAKNQFYQYLKLL